MMILEQFSKLILHIAGNTRIFFNLEEGKEAILDFSQGTVKVL